jgi:hypothetical protein
MKIKIKWFFTLIFLLSTFISQAQENQVENPNYRKENKEKIKALYAAYITQQLKFNEAEAEKFWPVQHQFSEEIKNTNKQRQLSELEREETTLNIRKKYNEKFIKIIGKERTDLFFKKDKEFRNKMVEGLKKKRMENRGGKKNQE